jgi:hypothetical protein
MPAIPTAVVSPPAASAPPAGLDWSRYPFLQAPLGSFLQQSAILPTSVSAPLLTNPTLLTGGPAMSPELVRQRLLQLAQLEFATTFSAMPAVQTPQFSQASTQPADGSSLPSPPFANRTLQSADSSPFNGGQALSAFRPRPMGVSPPQVPRQGVQQSAGVGPAGGHSN